MDLHAACDNGTEIIKVHDAGFLPIFHDVHKKDYTTNYRYACSGDIFRKDPQYETDDRFKCDIAFREVFTMKKLSEEWVGYHQKKHDLLDHLPKDSDCMVKELWKYQTIFV